MDHERLFRRFLERKKQQAERRGDGRTVDAIEHVLHDELMFCGLCCESVVACTSQRGRLFGQFEFLRYLLENWQTILENILKLIDLFSGTD